MTNQESRLMEKFSNAAMQIIQDHRLSDQQMVTELEAPLKGLAKEVGHLDDSCLSVVMVLGYLIEKKGMSVSDIQDLKDKIRAEANAAGHTGFVNNFDQYAPQ